MPPSPEIALAQRAREAHARLARTINIAPDFGGPLERGGWTRVVERADLDACAEHGFTAIRLLTYLTSHRTPTGLDPSVVRGIDTIIDTATELGLAVVISNHRDPQLMVDPDTHLPATLATVAELTKAFAGRGPGLVIEPVAEPQDALDPIWNQVVPELVGAIREHDRDRTILLGPRTRNNARFLGELALPEAERNLIVGIHHYWPITFTMQGETWLGQDHIFGDPATWIGTTWDQTPADEAELRTGFDQVAAWSTASARPMFLAEFGTTSNADLPSRARWTRFNRELAERHGFSWGIWSLGPSFAIYNPTDHTFNPDLLAALIDEPAQRRS